MSFKIGPQDLGRKRLFDNNGFKYEFEAIDPYGMVKATCLSNKKPLAGMFTSFKEAEKAAVNHSLKINKNEKIN